MKDFYDKPFESQPNVPREQQAITAALYAANQLFHIRRALERIAASHPAIPDGE
jgi:hypothetical protein